MRFFFNTSLLLPFLARFGHICNKCTLYYIILCYIFSMYVCYAILFLMNSVFEFECASQSLADHMNAEIVNGTINSIKEAASWLSYTFLFVRMCLNPVSYGMTFEERFADPQVGSSRVVHCLLLIGRCGDLPSGVEI